LGSELILEQWRLASRMLPKFEFERIVADGSGKPIGIKIA
jgi:hypothetical protein